MPISSATGKPLTQPAHERAKAYTVNRAAAGGFVRRGLRAYFEYRDLGIEKSSKGKVVAHVIKARPEKAPHGAWHSHACNLQFVYVLKGWLKFEYEGVPQVITVKAGDCFVQPPNILHREIAHSKNMELLEVVAPADFKTLDGPKLAAPPVKQTVTKAATKAVKKAAKKPAKK